MEPTKGRPFNRWSWIDVREMRSRGAGAPGPYAHELRGSLLATSVHDSSLAIGWNKHVGCTIPSFESDEASARLRAGTSHG
jgi:hypothetical protein